MAESKEQFTKEEEIKVELTPPLQQLSIKLPPKRKTPIKRYNATPLQEDHGQTIEADRFRED